MSHVASTGIETRQGDATMGLRKTWRPMPSTSASLTLMALRGSSLRSRLIPTCKLLPICCCQTLDSLATHSPSSCLFPERMIQVATTTLSASERTVHSGKELQPFPDIVPLFRPGVVQHPSQHP